MDSGRARPADGNSSDRPDWQRARPADEFPRPAGRRIADKKRRRRPHGKWEAAAGGGMQAWRAAYRRP